MARLWVLVALLLIALVAPAQAGKAITPRPDCPGQYLTYSDANAARYRDALLCLMSAIREDQGLNALTRSAKLEKAGRRWANRLGETGHTDHGKSVAEIPERIARAHYRAAAVNEGLGLGEPTDTAYDVMRSMMLDFACTEILDPRFRDAGVGVDLGRLNASLGGRGIHVVVEFGLRRGARPPSSRTKPARTCGHRLPAPPASPVVPAGKPVVAGDDITVTVRCAAKHACAFNADLKLAHEGSVAHAKLDSLEPGSTAELQFVFSPGAIAAEQAGKAAGVDLTLASTKPYTFDDQFSVGL